jgi:hypothetical protein
VKRSQQQKDKHENETTNRSITVSAASAFAGHLVPHIAMPVGIGYATDAQGARHPNALCVRDALYAPAPRYPLGRPSSQDWASLKWELIECNGLYRLDIDPTTGRVTKVTIIRSGTKDLNDLSVMAFKLWKFKPGTWKEVIIPTTMRRKWEQVVVK